MKLCRIDSFRLFYLTSFILFNLLALPAFSQNVVNTTIIKDVEVRKAVDLYDKGDYPKAKSILEGIVQKNDKNDEAHYVLSIVFSRMNNLDDAKTEAKKTIDLKSNVAEYHYNLASMFILDAKTASFFRLPSIASTMKEELFTAQGLDPNHKSTMYALAMYYIHAPGIMGGDNDKAIEQANRLLTIDEKQGRSLLCQLYFTIKDYEKAVEEANKLIKIDEYTGRYFLINIYKKQENLSKAEIEFKNIENKFGSNSDYFAFFNDYGYFLLGQNRVDEAIDKFKKQVALAPKNANAHDSYGEALLKKGMLKESLAEYNKALEIDPNLKNSKDKIAEINKQLKN
jgi:tetratricopeptide (TPR) repeat protein